MAAGADLESPPGSTRVHPALREPSQPAVVRNNVDLKTLRAGALYGEDAAKTLRKSHDNPVVQEVYRSYFGGEPLEVAGNERAHHVLHTSYHARTPKY